jgi:dTDP-4-amino-4,6-dideoxygalactose transaminase
VGTFGHLAVFSHYPSKNLPAFGDAGTIVCDEENIFDSLVSLANYGSDKSNKYIHDRLGYNCRMDSMQAAILSLNLHYVDEWNKTRIQLAEIYRQNLEELPIRLLHDSKSGSVFHHFCILVEQRSQLIDYLSQRGIQTAIHYPIPPYREVMKWGEFKQEHQFRCESAERISSSILSLPISQWHTPEMIRFVGLTVREFYHVT